MWSIAGTGDFDGDGKSDILWYNGTSGAVAAWLMNAAAVTSVAGIAMLPPSAWAMQTAGAD
jgi:hypothetical protein